MYVGYHRRPESDGGSGSAAADDGAIGSKGGEFRSGNRDLMNVIRR